MSRTIPKEIIDKAVDLYQSGESYQKVADTLGYSRSAIRTHLRKRGIGRTRSEARPKKLTEKHRKNISKAQQGVPKKTLKKNFTKMTPELAYILGVCMFDAHVCQKDDTICKNMSVHGIRLESRDVEFNELFARCVEVQIGYKPPTKLYGRSGMKMNIRGKVYSRANDTYLTVVNRIQFTEFIVSKLNLKMELLSYIPKQFYRDFIRGAWDSEGSITHHKSGGAHVQWVNTTRWKFDLIYRMLETILPIELFKYVKKNERRQGEKIRYEIYMYQSDLVRFFFLLVQPTIERKWEIFFTIYDSKK